MTVFEFKVFYSVEDIEPQYRYVAAETEDEAIEKLEKHFDKLAKEGCMKPVFYTDPTVEIDEVIA